MLDWIICLNHDGQVDQWLQSMVVWGRYDSTKHHLETESISSTPEINQHVL